MESSSASRRLRLRLRRLDRPGFAPFVCDGDPARCRVFIVGLNPARSVSFWPFWTPARGFLYKEWLKAYDRATHGKRTTTRARMIRIVDGLARHGIRCLTTNIYPFPSPRFRDLAPNDRDARAFACLVEAISPTIILVHGNEAIRPLELPKFSDTLVSLRGRSIVVRALPHLSTSWWTATRVVCEIDAVAAASQSLARRGLP
jgi:hypothetical protein